MKYWEHKKSLFFMKQNFVCPMYSPLDSLCCCFPQYATTNLGSDRFPKFILLQEKPRIRISQPPTWIPGVTNPVSWGKQNTLRSCLAIKSWEIPHWFSSHGKPRFGNRKCLFAWGVDWNKIKTQIKRKKKDGEVESKRYKMTKGTLKRH